MKDILSAYTEQIKKLKETKWMDKNIRLFLCGDYAFLSSMAGISGAKGTYCCLCCNIKSCNMKVSRQIRGRVEERTCDSIIANNKFLKEANGKKTGFTLL